jgi:chemosensory pili system protein ChpC
MSERIAEIYSLLIPLADSRLLVPRACVAEVIGYQTAAPMEGAPPWYLGLVNWNARSLPLISFECACGQPIPPTGGRSRVVVFHAIGGRLDAGYFGIVSQGFPQLVRVSNDVVRPDHSRSFSDRAPVLCQIRMLNETPLIPDLERLEIMIAEETSVMPELDAG